MIQEKLDELQETWDLTHYEMDDIKNLLIDVCTAVQIDSKIRDELDQLIKDNN